MPLVRRRRLDFITVVVLGSVVLGCNKSPYELAQVVGTVTIDGQPLTAGSIMFSPNARDSNVNSGKPAFGRIQSDGSYSLTTYSDGDGAIAGSHWVTIFSPAKDSTGMTDVSTTSSKLPDFDRITVPTGTFDVAADKENRIDIQLTSQQIARYGSKTN